MIPWAALKALPWKWIAAGVLGLALILTGVRINAWRHAYLELQDVQAALEAERDCAEGTECAKRAAEATVKAQAATTEAVASYEQELAALRNRPPVRAVRLCPAAGNVQVPAPPAGTGAGTAAAGVVSGGTGSSPDIGPALYALADLADRLSAQCRAVIHRDQALAGSVDE